MTQNILNLNMIMARSLTKSNFDYAIKIMEETYDFFLLNRNNYHRDIVIQTLDVLVKNYGEIQYKFQPETVVFKEITKYMNLYIKELLRYELPRH